MVPGAGWVLPAWLLCCAILLWLFRNDLVSLSFRDPDDAMRLQQVRDWVSGQSFWDVSQHRVNPPLGGPMHWSRLVDMPIAAAFLLLRPLLGNALGETVACAIVPLLLLGSLTWALFVAARRIEGGAVALLAAVLLLTTPTILVQFGPLRIDHHGWQILMATIALCGAMDPRRLRGGTIAGLALAVWLQISSEGLPYAALFAALFAVQHWRSQEETPRFLAFAMILGGTAVTLLGLLRGEAALIQQQCDSLSAAYVWPLVAFAIATPAAFFLIRPASARTRFFTAAIGGTVALAVFLKTGQPCLTGDPFKALGPVAYKLWYLKVMEGRPIWEQFRSMVGLILLPPLIGLAGSITAAWASKEAEARERWIIITLLLAAATIVAMLVMRALSVAHVMALPGISWLLLHLFQRAQRQKAAVVRVIGSSSIALLTPAALCAVWIIATSSDGGDDPPHPVADCRSATALAALQRLPVSTLFAPLDMGPDILIRTSHSVIGTAHHRNAAGITAVVEGFTGPPEQAKLIISRLNGGRGTDYVIACPGLNEFKHYTKEHRGSFAAALSHGRIPDWLRPVPLARSGPVRIYKVIR